jgi:CHAT domain-containing protein
MKAFFFRYIFILGWGCTAYAQTSSTAQISDLNQQAEQYYYSQKDSANYYYEQALTIQQQKKDTHGIVQTYFNLAGVASYHYDLPQSVTYLNILDSLLKDQKNSNEIAAIENRNILRYYQGDYHYKIYQNAKSIEVFRDLLTDIQKVPEEEVTPTMNDLTTAAYGFLGKMYMLEGQYERAREIYERNIRELSVDEKSNRESLNDYYNLLAQVLMAEKNYQQANKYLLQNFNYNQTHQNKNAFIYGGFYLSESYLNLQQTDSALYFLNKLEPAIQDNPLFTSLFNLNKAKVFAAQDKNEEALDALNNAMTVTINNQDSPSGNHHEIFQLTGDIQYKLGQPEKAINNYENALKALKISGAEAINGLSTYKRISQVFNSANNYEGFKKTVETVWKASHLIDSLRPSFTGSEDKFVLIENAFPIFENGLEAYHQMSLLKPNDSLVQKMFQLMEKSKSVVSLETLMATRATRFSNIPNELIQQEELLKGQILSLEKSLQRSTEDTAETEKALFQQKEKYQQLIAQIEQEYPKYHQLKYGTKTTQIEILQKVLDTDQAFISYFYGQQYIYAISVSKTDTKVAKIRLNEELEKNIEEFRKKVSNPKSNVKELKDLSLQLYNDLLAPIVPKRNKKLIIAPDGPLNYIPFSALSNPEKPEEFLVQSKAISHSNSATLYMQLLHRNENNGKLLAFAPSFQGQTIEPGVTRNNLSPLPHNNDEVQALSHLFESSVYTQNEASLINFHQKANEYEIVHLATHAVYNNDQPDFSYLAFTPNEEGFLLYVKDLYNMQINANLVTLSACETALGDLKKGEGLIGLTRGFFYSGAKSITSSLWNVNDASTTQMMGDYYQYLARGENKAVALQMAQKDFLELHQENALAHPYYWSGFILHGNPVKITQGNAWSFLMFPMIVLAAITIFFFRKKMDMTR